MTEAELVILLFKGDAEFTAFTPARGGVIPSGLRLTGSNIEDCLLRQSSESLNLCFLLLPSLEYHPHSLNIFPDARYTSNMRTSVITATLAFAATTLAQGWGNWGGYGKGPHGAPVPCLNQTSVDYLVNGYTYLLEHPGGPDFNATANAILSDKFFVSSDSINTLSQRPVR